MAHRDSTVLIVDNEPSMCWILSKVLAGAGHRVKTATSGKEALNIVNYETIPLAILDYRLSDTNGIALFKELKKKNSNIFGILITSYGSEALRKRALKSGFSFYFDKPLNNQQLVNAVRTAITTLAKNR